MARILAAFLLLVPSLVLAGTPLEEGQDLFKAEDYKGALRKFSQALKRDKKAAAPRIWRCRTYTELAFTVEIASAAEKRYRKSALKDAERATKLEPKNPEAWFWRAKARYWLDLETTEAFGFLDRAINLKPDYAAAHSAKGHMLEIGAGALPHHENAIKSDPNYRPAYSDRANCRLLMGDLKPAMEDYARHGLWKRNEDGSYSLIYSSYFMALGLSGDKKALNGWKRPIEKATDFYARVAAVWLGQLSADQFIRSAGDKGLARLHVGMWLCHTNQKEAGRRQFQGVVQEETSVFNKDAAKVLEEATEAGAFPFAWEQKPKPPAPQANFCSQCGKKFSGSAKFCANCGAKR